MLGVSLRAGKLMGARDAAGARAAVRAVFVLSGGYSLVAAAVVAAAHAAVVPVFTDPGSEAGALVARNAFVLSGVLVLDCLQGTAGGALRGVGSPATGALSSVVSYLFVGMPLSWVLAKVLGLGLIGIRGACAALRRAAPRRVVPCANAARKRALTSLPARRGRRSRRARERRRGARHNGHGAGADGLG
jgi:Na+-driven multidrug efflux pump